MYDFTTEMATQVGEVFAAHPELDDHRAPHPWLTGWLGDPGAPVWFVSENPSATQVDRIHSAAATPESQWAASRGDALLREALVEHGLKLDGEFTPGGWRCYLTNVMKSEVFGQGLERDSLAGPTQGRRGLGASLALRGGGGEPQGTHRARRQGGAGAQAPA